MDYLLYDGVDNKYKDMITSSCMEVGVSVLLVLQFTLGYEAIHATLNKT